MEWDQVIISKTYLKKQLAFDVILTLPMGLIFGAIFNPLEYLSIIKVFRAKEVVAVLQPSVYNDKIRKYYEKKLESVLKNEMMMFDVMQCKNYIGQRINA